MKTWIYYLAFLIIGAILGIIIGNLVAPICPEDAGTSCINNAGKYPTYGFVIGAILGLISGKIIKVFKK